MSRVTYKPASRRPGGIAQAVRAVTRDFAEKAKELVAQPTSTWKHQIDFAIDDVSNGDDLTLNVHAVGDNARIYRYVDEGTSVRHAQMTAKFVPKTRVGSLAAGPGAGGLKQVSKQIVKPGIQARGFSGLVADELRPEFTKAIRKAIGG